MLTIICLLLPLTLPLLPQYYTLVVNFLNAFKIIVSYIKLCLVFKKIVISQNKVYAQYISWGGPTGFN